MVTAVLLLLVLLLCINFCRKRCCRPQRNLTIYNDLLKDARLLDKPDYDSVKKFGILTSSLFYWTQKVQNRVDDCRTHFCVADVIVQEMRSRSHSLMTETQYGKVSIRRQYF